MRKPFILLMLLCILIPTIPCTMAKEDSDMTYEMINMAEAREIFEKEGDYIILDVRTWEEYNDGHIPGAICIPNETIGTEEIPELPDKEQVIFALRTALPRYFYMPTERSEEARVLEVY